MPAHRPIVLLRLPPPWSAALADEVQYRLAHGCGNARAHFAIRDAILSASPGIPEIKGERGDWTSRARESGTRAQSVTLGPTIIYHLDMMKEQGWRATTFARSALHHYLFALSHETRPRNLPGCDPAFDPLNPDPDA